MPAPIDILVVEDSEPDYVLLCDTLARQGISAQCERVETAEQMKASLERRAWHLVISDHHLPAFSSPQALAVLRAHSAYMPFVIVSGTMGEDAAVRALQDGADDYLIKGRLTRLAAAIRRALEVASAREERERTRVALAESEHRLRALSAHLQIAIEQERRSIAREIHDDVGGALTALRFDLAWFARQGQPLLSERVTQATATLDQAMQASQRIMRNLRPPILEAGLVPALQWQVAQFRKRSSTALEFRCNRERIDLPEDQALTVFRIIQEALTNIAKHAQARSARIDLIVSGEQLSVEVADDGKGLQPGDLGKANSFGLRGLSERANACGGWLELARSGSGTTLLLSLPLPSVSAP